MRSLLQDPLVPFLMTTALVFIWGRTVLDPPPDEPTRINVSRSAIEAAYAQSHGRAPSKIELEDAVDREIEQELMYRYARHLGLDEGDAIVRRRLVQKLGFVLEDLAALETPSDDALRVLLVEDTDRYRSEDRWDLRQVFTSREVHGPHVEATAAERFARAKQGEEVQGEPFVLGRRLEGRTRAQIEQTFGPHFFEAFVRLEARTWSEPIPSPYGLHMVFVERRMPGRRLGLEEARKALTQRWLEQTRDEAKRRAVERLRGQYRVVIDGADERAN